MVGGPPEDAVVGDELVLGGYLHVVSRLGLPVVHRVLLHVHEGRVSIGLAVAVPLAQGLQLVLMLAHLWGVLVFHLLHGLAHFFVADAHLVHLVEDFVGAPLHLLRAHLGLPLRHLQLKGLLRLLQHGLHLPLQLRLVLLHAALPHEGVLVGRGLYLRAVDVLHVQRHEPLLVEQHHHLGEQAVETTGETLAAEEVDGVVVGCLPAAQPHVGDVLHKQLLHLAPRVHIVEVGVDHHLQEHPRMVAAGASSLVGPLDLGDVKPVDDGADHAGFVVLGKIIAQTRGKEKTVVLIVRFKCYFCPCHDVLFVFVIWRYKNTKKSSNGNGYLSVF